jgi:hypothetical protein
MSIHSFDKWVPWITFGFYVATGLVVVLASVRLFQEEELAIEPTSPDRTSISSSTMKQASFEWVRPLQYGFRTPVEATTAMAEVPIEPEPDTAMQLVQPIAPSRDLGLKLVGTVIEANRSTAIVMDQIGNLDFCLEQQSIQLEPSGIFVSRISDAFIEVDVQGTLHKWTLGQSLTIGSPTSPVSQPHKSSPAKVDGVEPPPVNLDEELERLNGGR